MKTKITDIYKLKGKTIKNVVDGERLYLVFKDNTWCDFEIYEDTVQYICFSAVCQGLLSKYDVREYLEAGIITQKEYDKVLKESKAKEKEQDRRYEIDQLKMLKLKYPNE